MGSGVILGVAGQVTGHEVFWQLSVGIAPLGALWLNALQMAVVPLVITQLLTALVNDGEHSSLGILGGKAVMLFFTLLMGAGALTLLTVTPVLSLLQLPPDWASAVVVESIPEAASQAANTEGFGFGDWLIGLIPQNPLEAATKGNLLQTLIFTVFVGLAISRLPAEQRKPLAELFRGLGNAMMLLVSWILWGTPVGVFCLLLPLGLENGLGTLAFLGVYLALVCSALLAVTLLMYPVTALAGRVSIRAFAKAVAPAQIVAVSTQSSLASLPALIVGGKEHLDLPEESTAFVLPLCVSTFKLNQTVSQGVVLLFLAMVFGINLTPQDQVTFLFGIALLSFGVPGVPRGLPFLTLPLLLAVGIPIEGVVILEAVKTIPDIFMTTLNVTGDMSVATILSRGDREPRTSV
jgi:Na+/H+-dicarboxylate symporter